MHLSIHQHQKHHINQEKMRILAHLNAIKSDCDALTLDVQKTLKLRDVDEEDEFAPFTGGADESE